MYKHFRSIITTILPLILISAVLFSSLAFNGSCGKAPPPPPCTVPPCASPTPTPDKKAEALAKARSLNNAIRNVARIVTSIKPALGSILVKATNASDQIITAITNDNATSIPKLLADIFPVIDQVAAEFSNDKTVLIFLALADVALSYFTDQFTLAVGAQVTSPNTPTARAIKAFQTGPHFHARDAKTGRYVTIEYAQAHPDTTVIERQ